MSGLQTDPTTGRPLEEQGNSLRQAAEAGQKQILEHQAAYANILESEAGIILKTEIEGLLLKHIELILNEDPRVNALLSLLGILGKKSSVGKTALAALMEKYGG